MDRVTRLRIKNVRAIESLDLVLGHPLTVLIGENGAGKSTIIECLELLRKAADPNFIQQFYNLHRGLPALLRKGATFLHLGVVVEDDAGVLPCITYDFTLETQGAGAIVQSECLLLGPTLEDAKRGQPLELIRRVGATTELFDRASGKMVAAPLGLSKINQLLLTSFGNVPPEKAIERLLNVLLGIEVHLGFDTLAAWAARSYQRPISVRGATTHFPADRLSLLGFNLANAWSELRNRKASHWEKTMAIVRLGLGERVDSVLVTPDMSGGNVSLALRYSDLVQPILASDLSDGQLAWLAFVAMARLNEGRSLLAIDEPELHMHPSLLGGVITLLTTLDAPVLIATHSDHVLEMLEDPAGAVRVCSLEDQGRAIVRSVDGEKLSKWKETFGDFARLRAAGYLSRVLRPSVDEVV